MDFVRELETAQDLDQWRWLFGAIQQQQTALAMLLELLKNPSINEASQITKGLDYIFEPPSEFTSMSLIRLRCIATQLRDYMQFYTSRYQPGGSQDVPALDPLDSSTCSSSATPGDASSIIQSNHSEVSDTSAFPSRSVPHHGDSPRRFIDIDAVSQTPKTKRPISVH